LGKHKIARLAVDYIYRNCHRGITTSEISEYINVSTSHLCRCFKEATGVSVIEYAERIRCRKAKEDLSLGIYSVSQVAEKYHFNSLSYFNRRYKKSPLHPDNSRGARSIISPHTVPPEI
jgi:AraC-like DNA-binding protein